MAQQFINQRFSSDITSLNKQSLLSKTVLSELSKICSKQAVKAIKAIGKYDYRNGFDRQTVTIEYLVKSNLRIAMISANKYFEVTGANRKKKCDIDDLIQECMIGLTCAARKYIETKDGQYSDYGFAQYARNWTDKYARDFINNGFNPVKLTTHEGSSNVLANCSMRSLDDRYSMPGSDSEMQSSVFNELRTEANQDELSDIKEMILRKRELMSKLLSVVNDKEMNILTLMYGLSGDNPRTDKELAKLLKTRPVRINQTHNSAIEKIKESNSITPIELIELTELAKTLDYTDYEFKELYGNIVDCPWETSKLDISETSALSKNSEYISKIALIIKETKIIDSLRNHDYESMSVFSLKLDSYSENIKDIECTISANKVLEVA